MILAGNVCVIFLLGKINSSLCKISHLFCFIFVFLFAHSFFKPLCYFLIVAYFMWLNTPLIFLQLNPTVNSFQRKFVTEIKKCEEMERILGKGEVLFLYLPQGKTPFFREIRHGLL